MNKLGFFMTSYKIIFFHQDEQLLTAMDIDPFYEHEENHNLIGVANVYMSVLFHNVVLDYYVPVVSQQGEVSILGYEVTRNYCLWEKSPGWPTAVFLTGKTALAFLSNIEFRNKLPSTFTFLKVSCHHSLCHFPSFSISGSSTGSTKSDFHCFGDFSRGRWL